MKLIFIITAMFLLAACNSSHPAPTNNDLAKKHDSMKMPQWEMHDDGPEYCDANICAKSVAEYRWIYSVLEAKAGF